MSPVDDVIVDLDAALDRLASAIGNDDVETRRALRESLACLYELRVYRAGTSRDEKTGYHNRAALSQAGNRLFRLNGATRVEGADVGRP